MHACYHNQFRAAFRATLRLPAGSTPPCSQSMTPAIVSSPTFCPASAALANEHKCFVPDPCCRSTQRTDQIARAPSFPRSLSLIIPACGCDEAVTGDPVDQRFTAAPAVSPHHRTQTERVLAMTCLHVAQPLRRTPSSHNDAPSSPHRSPEERQQQSRPVCNHRVS